ncbi:MAG: amino acid ABC transporter substrate-binding protein [Gammaproteobacteria bacterium]|nr:amino acid ABC transporter substrate-binding protein [Gammaproteobacteria bacterium]
MSIKRLVGLLMSVCLFSVPALSPQAAGTLDEIKASGTMVIAYSPDLPPFSFHDDSKRPAGYSVAICERVVAGLQSRLGLSKLKVKWVQANTPDRLQAVAQGKAHMECGTTTVTLSRQEKVDFSNEIFVESGGVLVKSDADINKFSDLAGKRIAVIPGTTIEQRLGETLDKRGIDAKLVPVEQANQGRAALDSGRVDAHAGDRLVLLEQASAAKDPGNLSMLTAQFSVDPYAFAITRGEPDFRLAVNRILAELYRSGEIEKIFARWFGPNARPSGLLQAVYFLNAYAD